MPVSTTSSSDRALFGLRPSRMGWFWDSKTEQSSQSTNGDAYRNLDPSLRDFLDKQTPPSSHEPQRTPTTTRPQSQPPSPLATQPETPYRKQLGLDSPGLTTENQNPSPNPDRPSVPAESLFQDGRYADLWKTYRSQAELDANSRSDQDKLANVMEMIRDRKAAIGRAALENCVEEQLAQQDCYKHGSVADRMTMCTAQTRAFSKCYSMQSRFLKALGYLSSQYTSPADEEKIQMHADKLYHEMLEREKMIEESKASGKEAPAVGALIPSDETTRALGEESAWARARRKAEDDGASRHLNQLPLEKQREVRERLKSLTPAEREVELQLLAAEQRAMWEYTEQIDQELRAQQRQREERKGRGSETVGDTIKRLWGFGNR